MACVTHSVEFFSFQVEELEMTKDEQKPLVEKNVQLGNKNMTLNQTIRRQENRMKDLQTDNIIKVYAFHIP